MNAPTNRPTAVTVIGWLFIAFGAMAVVGAIGSTVMFAFTPMHSEMEKEMAQAPEAFRAFFVMFRYQRWFGLAQFVVGLAGIAGGVGLLRLRGWARLLCEVICWLGLVYSVAFSVIWVRLTRGMGESSANFPPYFGTFMLVAGVVGMFFNIIPLAVLIYFLRSRTVREAIAARPVS